MGQWLERYLSEQDHRAISAAVAKAESQTSGEVIPVIVRRSSAVGHVPWILTALFSLILIGSEVRYFSSLLANWWHYLIPALLATAYGFAFWLARYPLVQRWLTPNQDETRAVWQRAELEFYRARVTKTKRRTGVLIFVSVMERQAVILADQGVAEKVAPEVWQEQVSILTRHLRRKQWRQGLEEVIANVGGILAQHLPREVNDANEHPDQLIVRD